MVQQLLGCGQLLDHGLALKLFYAEGSSTSNASVEHSAPGLTMKALKEPALGPNSNPTAPFSAFGHFKTF